MSRKALRFKRETLGVAVLLCLASLFILYPFMDAIILATATSYILRFAHTKMDSFIDNEFLSTLTIITGVFGTLLLGLYLFITNFGVILQGLNSVTMSLQDLVLDLIEALNLPAAFRQNVQSFIDSFSDLLRQRIVSIFAGIPSVIVHLGIFTVTSIYLYKDGARIEGKISEIIENLPEEERKISISLIDSVDYIFRGVFVTQVLVALTLGLMAGIGFYIISLVTSPMPLIPIWAIMIGISSLLPLVANFMIYLPLGGYYLMTGSPVKGSLVMAFGFVMLQLMPEIFLRPFIGSKQMDEHPLIIFTGFIAGPLTLGLKGLILGPVILILTEEFINDYATLVSE
ncbi:MAG: AI-2E family transporter [Candidatus Nanohaloarchaea archaeon]